MSSGAAKGRKHEETIVKRVSRKGHHDEHGGNWKVAFADFCLALLCLFMVLWVLSARDEEAVTQKLALSIAYDNGRGVFEGDRSSPAMPKVRDAGVGQDTSDDPAVLREMADEVRRLAADLNLDSNLQVVVTPMGLRVVLHDTYQRGVFELGSSTAEDAFADLIVRMGGLFLRMGNPVLVIGHTDSAPYREGAGRTNWHLSADRAMAARQLLVRGGLTDDRLLQVIGMADRTLIDPVRPRAAINRRIEFMLLTQERARDIRQMFGAPERLVPFTDGAQAVPSDEAAEWKGPL